MFIIIHWSKYHYYAHFIHDKTEEEGDEVTSTSKCPAS